MSTLPHFKIYNKIITYPKCGTKYMDKIYGNPNEHNHIDFYELFNEDIKFIIVRDPKSHLISAINETIKYEENLKKNLESLLVGNNIHWNPNHYRLLELYIKLNPDKTIVKLEDLNNFLEFEMKIKLAPFTVDFKTVKIYDLEKIKEEEPYLTDLILRNLEFESYSYNNILNDNYVYRPQKKII